MMRRPRKPATESTALAVISETGTELALPDALIGRARNYAAKSRSTKTLAEYAKWWKKFQRWCDANGRDALPANLETIGGYMTWLADGQQGAGKRARWAEGHQLAMSSINVAIAAVKFRHRSKGFAVDTDHPTLQAITGGIRRELAKTRTTRRVKPIMNADLREMLEMLRPEVPREARDAAMLALGWAAALRRSELVGLDLGHMGTIEDDGRKGFVALDERGMTITLMTSKASQDTAQTVVVPRDFAPLICAAVENWIKVGQIEPGQPLFRGVKGHGWSSNPQSGYVGVAWHNGLDKWMAQYSVAGKSTHLGYFDGPREGHLAYCKAKGIKPAKPHDGSVSAARITTWLVAAIVKRRVHQLASLRNKSKGRKKLTPEEMKQLTDTFSGHSMRVGFVTSAAERDVPTHRIKEQTRHKTDSMVSVYIREVDKHKNSALKGGVGF